MGTAKKSIHRQRRKRVTDEGLGAVLPTSVQRSYFMLSDTERAVLNTALEKYQPERPEPILVGDEKPALRLMTWYRLKIEEVLDGWASSSLPEGGGSKNYQAGTQNRYRRRLGNHDNVIDRNVVNRNVASLGECVG